MLSLVVDPIRIHYKCLKEFGLEVQRAANGPAKRQLTGDFSWAVSGPLRIPSSYGPLMVLEFSAKILACFINCKTDFFFFIKTQLLSFMIKMTIPFFLFKAKTFFYFFHLDFLSWQLYKTVKQNCNKTK